MNYNITQKNYINQVIKVSNMKQIIKKIGLWYLIGTNLVMVGSFLLTYFSPSKTAIISINKFDEANIELIIISLGTLLSFWIFYDSLKNKEHL